MDITIKGTPKEIADLVLELQSQQLKDSIFSVNYENLYKVVKEQSGKLMK